MEEVEGGRSTEDEQLVSHCRPAGNAYAQALARCCGQRLPAAVLCHGHFLC